MEVAISYGIFHYEHNGKLNRDLSRERKAEKWISKRMKRKEKN